MATITPNPDKIIQTTPNKATKKKDVRGLLKNVDAKKKPKRTKKGKKAKKKAQSQPRRRRSK